MNDHDDWQALREFCLDELGEHVGSQLAALARPALELSPAADDGGTGRWGFGGPALLEPGTPWPEFGGLPLSPLAVLDLRTDADWLGDYLPERLGLLSLFILDPDLDYEEYKNLDYGDHRWMRAIPVDPATAVEVPPAAPARAYERASIRAEQILLLPYEWGDEVHRIVLGPGSEDKPPGMVVGDACREWNGQFGNVALGWPQWVLGPAPGWRDGHHVPLLKISDQFFHSCPLPAIYFSIPAEALKAGDFSQTTVYGETY